MAAYPSKQASFRALVEGDKLDEDEEERLYYTIICNDIAHLQQMIKDGINVNAKFEGSNQLNKSVLHLCCEKGLYECAKLLLEAGAFPDAMDAWYQRPLMYAVCTEREDMVQLMIEAKCYMNARDRFGKTALHYSVSNTELGCLNALLKSKADVNAADEVGRTPLWLAVSEDGNETILERLLETEKCDVNKTDMREKRTPLHAALVHARKDSLKYIRTLLEHGASPNSVDICGQTAMTSLIRMRKASGREVAEDDLTIARMLMDYGYCADLSMTSKYTFQYQGTALMAAVERGAIPYVQLLLDHGADPDICNEKAVTPILLAAFYNFVEVGKLLIYANCCMNVSAEMKIGRQLERVSPFECAIRRGYMEFAELLVLAGYDLGNESCLQWTADIPECFVLNLEFWEWCNAQALSPPSLVVLCRRYIRKTLGQDLRSRVHELPLPPRIIDHVILMQGLLQVADS